LESVGLRKVSEDGASLVGSITPGDAGNVSHSYESFFVGRDLALLRGTMGLFE
jgi:hypothetical protein